MSPNQDDQKYFVIFRFDLLTFGKRLPGFPNLCQTDQLILLKAASSETMIRTARRYDPIKDTIVFSNNDAYDNSAYDTAGLRNDDFFQFCKLNVDDAEFAILTAITVFSDREHLVEKEKVGNNLLVCKYYTF